MIKTTKVYLDKAGGARIYIPMDMVSEIGWKDHESVILKTEKGEVTVSVDRSAPYQAPQGALEKLKKGSSEGKPTTASHPEVPA